MPALVPRPLAYVFKKELLHSRFLFGWSGLAAPDMIHIDRSQRACAFAHVIRRGKELLGVACGHHVPEGTRVPRGEQASPGQRRAPIEAGVPVGAGSHHLGAAGRARRWRKIPGVVDVGLAAPFHRRAQVRRELMQEAQAWIEAEMRRPDP